MTIFQLKISTSVQVPSPQEWKGLTDLSNNLSTTNKSLKHLGKTGVRKDKILNKKRLVLLKMGLQQIFWMEISKTKVTKRKEMR